MYNPKLSAHLGIRQSSQLYPHPEFRQALISVNLKKPLIHKEEAIYHTKGEALFKSRVRYRLYNKNMKGIGRIKTSHK